MNGIQTKLAGPQEVYLNSVIEECSPLPHTWEWPQGSGRAVLYDNVLAFCRPGNPHGGMTNMLRTIH